MGETSSVINIVVWTTIKTISNWNGRYPLYFKIVPSQSNISSYDSIVHCRIHTNGTFQLLAKVPIDQFTEVTYIFPL